MHTGRKSVSVLSNTPNTNTSVSNPTDITRMFSALKLLSAGVTGVIMKADTANPEQDTSLDGLHWHRWICATISPVSLCRFELYTDTRTFVDELLSEGTDIACAILQHLSRYPSYWMRRGGCNLNRVVSEIQRRSKSHDASDHPAQAKAFMKRAGKVGVLTSRRESFMTVLG